MCESKLSRALRPKLRYAVNTRGTELARIVSDTRTIAEIRFAENILHGKNDSAESSKILLNTNLKTILLGHQNNYVGKK